MTLTPATLRLDTKGRTGQSRRRRPRGFGRQNTEAVFYSVPVIDPARHDSLTPGKSPAW